MKQLTPYQYLARIYDYMQGDKFSARMVQYTFDILQRLKYSPHRVLDLCCGTGTAASIFAECGMEVYGLDGSKEMLAVAREKFKGHKQKIKLYHQQMPDIRLPHLTGSLDMVTCYFDSLNYLLLKNDLLNTFKKTHDLLVRGGLFIFDMNTPWALENIWTKTYADERDDMAWIWKGDYSAAKQISRLKTTMFIKKGNGWLRYDEIHVERGYDNITVRRLLNRAGFKVKYLHDCFKFVAPGKNCTRIAVVAIKK